MSELDNRPELPEVFPQTDVNVRGEAHLFNVSVVDGGTERQLEYTLDKAPVEEIQSVQGSDEDGNSRTFNKGVDYELTSKTETVVDEFEFDARVDNAEYRLTYKVNDGTDTIVDESGETYVNGLEYDIESSDTHYGDKVVWRENDQPDDAESFTVEYEVTFENSVLQWQDDAENFPDAGTEFYVSYRAESIISRYLDASETELDSAEQALQTVINNKFVDEAEGEALDRLGKIFGPVIGKRRGRTDEQYRIYLKSIVQSFVSRGTVEGIKLAVSAATDVPIEDITVREDFENVSYSLEVLPNTPVTISLLEEVADIADPSGVDYFGTKFATDPDDVTVTDTKFIRESDRVGDEIVGINDSPATFSADYFEDVFADDSNTVNANKFDAGIDQMFADDAFVGDSQTDVTWNSTSWDDSVWGGSVDK